MKINVISDLHLEFENFDHRPDADILILPGDIGLGSDGVIWARGIEAAFEIPTVYVAGNHEFYGGRNFPSFYDTLEADSGLVHFLQNRSVIIDGVKFIGATLWTDFNLKGDQEFMMAFAPRYMMDYRQIRNDDGTYLTPSVVLREHEKTIEFLEKELSEGGDMVVVTHHGPTPRSVHPKFEHSIGNEYFTSDLRQLILDHQPKLWCHGHTHCSINYMIGDTRVLANPRGYVYNGISENSEFDSKLTVEI